MMKEREFARYHQLREEGASARDVFLVARSDGMPYNDGFRMLHEVFGYSLEEAKTVMVTASGDVSSLEEHQERLIPGLKRALEDFEDS